MGGDRVQHIDPRLRAALTAQFARRRDRLRSGDRHLGWKVGAGTNERIGESIAVGHLLASGRLSAGGTYRPRPGEQLHADVEVAVLLGEATTPAGFTVALEICDLTGDEEDSASDIVAHNVFHRAVVLGDQTVPELPAGTSGTAVVNGQVADSARVPADIRDRVGSVGRILHAMDHQLRPGDWIITGSVVQVPVRPGDTITADLGPLGQISARIGEPASLPP
jgi:2-keto-4-pentenoate hydratase